MTQAKWQTFPKPEGDTGIGVHLSSENGGYSDDSLREAYALGIRWVKVLGIVPHDRLVACYKRGFMVVVRIYKDMNPWNRPLNGIGEVATMKRAAAEAGRGDIVPYIQIGNEPNLCVEWNEDGHPTRRMPDSAPMLAAGWWLPIARSVVAAGGIPITTPLAPGGDYNDWKWFILFLRELKRLGVTRQEIERCAIGIHNYTNNKPLDWGKGSYRKWTLHDFRKPEWTGLEFVPGHEDSQGFCMYEWYHDAVADIFDGADCAVISCEGGTYFKNNDIKYRPEVDDGLHARYITSQMALMMGDTVTDTGIVNSPMPGVPAWYFCTAFWTWGHQPNWLEGDLRLVRPVTKAAMRRMTIHPRTQPQIVVQPQPQPDPQPIYVKKLTVQHTNPGRGLVQGNVTPGAEVDVEFFGNHVRVKAGQKPELGAGGFEVNIHPDTREIVVSVSGHAPLRVLLDGTIPFIVEDTGQTPLPPVVQPPPVPEPQPTPPPQLPGDVQTSWTLHDFRRLTACENHFMHHLFVEVQDESGAALDGVKVMIHQLESGKSYGITSGEKGAGKCEAVLHAGRYRATLGVAHTPEFTTEIWGEDEKCGEVYGNATRHFSYRATFRRVRSVPAVPEPAVYMLEAGFAELAAKHPVRMITPVGVLEYTGTYGDALQRVTFRYGNKVRQGMLLYDKRTNTVRLVATEPDVVFCL